jgi:outer membrane protein assembly factor BamD
MADRAPESPVSTAPERSVDREPARGIVPAEAEFVPMCFVRSDRRPSAPRRLVGPAAAAVLLLAALSQSGCASKTEDTVIPDKPVEQLYNDAMDALMDEDYEKAAKLFDEVDRQHPYSVWATKGQLMSAFTHYREGKYVEAVVTLDHFIELHPAHENIDYAYYLKALCFYERITDVSRDQETTEKARTALEEVVSRFPDSKYAADAKAKLVLVRDQLAGKEMEIGRYYEDRGHYLAAINRFRTVVNDYPTTSHVKEALYRLTECYLALGVVDEAQRATAVLGYNFPRSSWYEDGYNLMVDEGHVNPAGKAQRASAPGTGPAGTDAGGASSPSASTNPGTAGEAKPADGDRSFLTRTWDWLF